MQFLTVNLILKIFTKKPSIFENLIFKKVNSKIFPAIKLKKNEFVSFTPIIINASNEVLVDQFLMKKYGLWTLLES